MAWRPDGYVHIRTWLEDEVSRRNQTWFDGNRRAFNDLADFMAQEWTVRERFALHVYDSGAEPDVIPLWRWRQEPSRRGGLALRRFGDSSFVGYVAIWRNLRLDMTAGDRSKVSGPAAPASTRSEAPSKRAVREINIKTVLKVASRIGPSMGINPESRTGRNKLAKRVHADPRGKCFSENTIKKILSGTYRPQVDLGLPGYFPK